MRRAFIGFCSSFVSDCVSNGMRVVKTYKQTSLVPLTYVECVRAIVAADGVGGLFWRGLLAKIVCNGVQSILFSILDGADEARRGVPRSAVCAIHCTVDHSGARVGECAARLLA